MANVIKIKNRTDGSEPAATALASGELGIKQVAASAAGASGAAASGKIYYGEDVDGNGTTVARAFGIGVKSGAGDTQMGVPIGGNLEIAAGSGISTTGSVSGDVTTVTIAATGGASYDGDINDLDIDGSSDSITTLADADLFIADDGGGGTNKKVTATVIKDYTRNNLRSDLAIGTTDPVQFGLLIVGADADGSDKTLTFGHSTIKTVMGIDDSADIFAINTDDAFESGNDFEIDASGNVTLGNGNLTVANGEVRTPNLGFSDGTNAMVIGSGGVVTFPQRAVFSSGLELNDSDILVGGIAKMDRVAGVADGNTFIDFGPSDVLTFKTGGTTAATINSSQLFTASAGITSTAAANTFGATSFSDANITNVGSISVDTIASDGSDITIDAGGDISLDAASGNIRILDGGALRCAIDTDSNADEIRFNIEEDDSEFVFRQYDDTEVLRIKDNASLGLLNAQATLSHSSNTVILDIPTSNDDFKISGDDGGSDIAGLKIDFGDAAKTFFGPDENIWIRPNSSSSPEIGIQSTDTTNSSSGRLLFNKNIQGSSNEVIGKIDWYGKDSSNNSLEEMGNLYVKVTDAAAGSETAKMYLSTKHSGTTYEMGMKFTGTYDIVWPATNGSNEQVLSTDGSGNLSWSSISGLSGGGESNQDAFSVIAVSGQTSCTADTATDTLTLAAAGGMTITTSGDTVTLNSANTNTTYTGGTNLTLSGTTFNVDDAFLKNNANDTTSGTITAGGFTTSGSITLGGHAFNDIDIGSEFNDVDDHLMSAGAIKEKIENYGYTTNTGDITGVTAGTGLSGGGSSGAVTLNVDASQTQITSVGTIGTGTWQGTAIASAYLDSDTAHLSGTQTHTGAKTFSGGVTLSGTTTHSGILDITNTTDSSDDSGDTGALRVEGGASIAKKLYVGTDLDVDGTAEFDNITIGGSQGSDGQVLTSTGSGVAWEDASGGGGGGGFDTAGTGLTSSGTTVNVIGGTGVTANANDIAIGQAVGTTDNVVFGKVDIDSSTGHVQLNNGYIEVNGDEGEEARILLFADQGDNNADKWKIHNTTSNVLEMSSKEDGGFKNKLTLTNASQLTLGQANDENGRYQVVSGANVLNGVTGTFDIPTDFAYDAMSGNIHVIGSQTITVTGGIITSIG